MHFTPTYYYENEVYNYDIHQCIIKFLTTVKLICYIIIRVLMLLNSYQ
jgi:hypothetical protein